MARKVTVIPAVVRRGTTAQSEAADKLRVAAYCRVSTEQEEQLGSFENQVEYYTGLIGSKEEWTLAGVFTDEGISGTGTQKRKGFMDMIGACENHLVDMVITKSISRFARNTSDSLLYSRRLKQLGIPVIFEKENINTMDASGELLFTIMSSLAQEESRNISENTQWGIRSRFQQGIPHLNVNAFLGYDKDDNGNLVIDEKQAEVVRRIYRDFLEGWRTSEISRRLNEENVPGIHGKAVWHPITIERILKNEKHVGDLLMQKTFTADFLTKTRKENHGEREQYYIRDAHEGIVSREDWDAVQLEMARRDSFRRRHGIRHLGSCTFDRFYARLFCACCGGKFVRHARKEGRDAYWRCEHAEKKKGHVCTAKNVDERILQLAVVFAWNALVRERETLLTGWQQMVDAGNALERYRGRLMIAVTGEGPLEAEVPELTRLFLEEIVVGEKPGEEETDVAAGKGGDGREDEEKGVDERIDGKKDGDGEKDEEKDEEKEVDEAKEIDEAKEVDEAKEIDEAKEVDEEKDVYEGKDEDASGGNGNGNEDVDVDIDEDSNRCAAVTDDVNKNENKGNENRLVVTADGGAGTSGTLSVFTVKFLDGSEISVRM